jgi:hypothetical protein
VSREPFDTTAGHCTETRFRRLAYRSEKNSMISRLAASGLS